MKNKLTDKQIRFCKEYIIDLNATQAAIRAGYAKNSAKQQGSRLLTNDYIQLYVQTLNKKVEDKLEITQERILKEYARLAFSDPRKLYNEDGSLKKVTELDDDTAATITEIEVNEVIVDGCKVGESKKIKQSNKKGALDSLAKINNMFQENINITEEVKIIKDDI